MAHSYSFQTFWKLKQEWAQPGLLSKNPLRPVRSLSIFLRSNCCTNLMTRVIPRPHIQVDRLRANEVVRWPPYVHHSMHISAATLNSKFELWVCVIFVHGYSHKCTMQVPLEVRGTGRHRAGIIGLVSLMILSAGNWIQVVLRRALSSPNQWAISSASNLNLNLNMVTDRKGEN